jgi:hypothetical protein
MLAYLVLMTWTKEAMGEAKKLTAKQDPIKPRVDLLQWSEFTF